MHDDAEVNGNERERSGSPDRGRPSPRFRSRAMDAQGRVIPLTPEERKARSEALRRTLEAIDSRPDDDPPGIEEEMMRGIDANRPPGSKLFEGYY